MIKNFKKKLEETQSEMMYSILMFIDKELEKGEIERKELSEEIKEVRNLLKGLDDIQAKLDSDAKTRALIKKVVITAIVGALVNLILNHLGIVGG